MTLAPPRVPPPGVEGDGTTATGRWRARWRRIALPSAILLGALVVAGLVTARTLPERGSSGVLDPNSAKLGGSKALAQVLSARGVSVNRVENVSETEQLPSDSTLVVVNARNLTDAALQRLAQTKADIVLVEPSRFTLDIMAPKIGQAGSSPSLAAVKAVCGNPVAIRADSITGGGILYAPTVETDASVSTCFGGRYVVTTEGGRQVSVVGQSDILRNDRIRENGNAALAVGTMGQHADLTWLMGSFADPANDFGADAPSPNDFLPDWFYPLVLLTFLGFVPLALWKGRRLGRLVYEPLPVIVRAAETVQGRATLYRRVGAYDRSLAILRASALRRAASCLGLPRSTAPQDIVRAWAAALGLDEAPVSAIVLGTALTGAAVPPGAPAPSDLDSGALLRRVADLDRLSEQLATATGRHPKGNP